MDTSKILSEALSDLNIMNLPEDVKKEVINARVCACDIIEHIDPMHINSMHSLKFIIIDIFSKHEKSKELDKFLSINDAKQKDKITQS